MIDAPSGGAPEKAPRWDLSRVQKVAAVELGFRGAPGCLGVRGRSTSVEQRGAHEGGGRAPCLVASYWIDTLVLKN